MWCLVLDVITEAKDGKMMMMMMMMMISDGQISNQISLPNHKSLDRKIGIFVPNHKWNLKSHPKSEIIFAQIESQF